MVLCSRCKERPAVVFVTRMDGNESHNEGYCLRCAKELNIGPVNQMLEKFGISDERSRACWNCSESSVSVYFILL